jgi:hypothetical protein
MNPTAHYRRPRSQRGVGAHGFVVTLALASGLAIAVGLQLAGPQLQARFASLLGLAPVVRVALPCPAAMAPDTPAMHAAKVHALAASYGIGVLPAI